MNRRTPNHQDSVLVGVARDPMFMLPILPTLLRLGSVRCRSDSIGPRGPGYRAIPCCFSNSRRVSSLTKK
jgi:hypothetical protein